MVSVAEFVEKAKAKLFAARAKAEASKQEAAAEILIKDGGELTTEQQRFE